MNVIFMFSGTQFVVYVLLCAYLVALGVISGRPSLSVSSLYFEKGAHFISCSFMDRVIWKFVLEGYAEVTKVNNVWIKFKDFPES